MAKRDDDTRAQPGSERRPSDSREGNTSGRADDDVRGIAGDEDEEFDDADEADDEDADEVEEDDELSS